MDPTSFAAAAFAPLVLWLLWRIQAVAIDQGLRRGMYRLLRYQRRTYNVVSWMGVLLHELSHAFFLLIGGHGIRDFKVRTDGGHVTPHQVRRGPVGLLTFLVAALAPMFVAPMLIFLIATLWLAPALLSPANAGLGWDAAWPVLRDTAAGLGPELGRLLLGLDVTTVAGAVILGLTVFAMPSARPSHVGRGRDAEGDIAVVRRKVRQRPLPVLVVAGLAYGSYFALVPWQPTWYWGFWQAAWRISLTATVLAVLLGLVWIAVSWAGRTKAWLSGIPAVGAVGMQIGGRMLEQPVWLVNAISLGVFALLALALWQAAPRRY